MMDLGLVNDKELVDLAVAAMKVAEDAKSALEKYKAEIQNRGLSVLTVAMWPCRSRRR